MIDHRSYVLNLTVEKIKLKKLRLKRAWTHDLCDTGAALLPTELSSQLGAGHLWVRNNSRNIPGDGEGI